MKHELQRRLYLLLNGRAERAFNDGVDAEGQWRSGRLRRRMRRCDRMLCWLEDRQIADEKPGPLSRLAALCEQLRAAVTAYEWDVAPAERGDEERS